MFSKCYTDESIHYRIVSESKSIYVSSIRSPMNPVWKNRNLQLYFSGQTVSLIGTWVQQLALSWLVYRLTNSTFMLGVIGFTSQAPALFVTPFAGIVADRVNRHRLILITQSLFAVQ